MMFFLRTENIDFTFSKVIIFSDNKIIGYRDTPVWLVQTRRQSQNSAVQSIQLGWTKQYKKCVQYDFKFTSIYSWECIQLLRNEDEISN